MPDLSAWWNPCEILALRRHPRLCLLMPMALWIFTLALKSCIKLSHLFCSGPLLRPEVLRFWLSLFHLQVIFLNLSCSLSVSWARLPGTWEQQWWFNHLTICKISHRTWSRVRGWCMLLSVFAVGHGVREEKLQFSKADEICSPHWWDRHDSLPPVFLSFLLWEAKAPKTRLLALKTALLFSVLP